MYKGIYLALSGAVLKQAHMDVISQNIANADTAGYKKHTLVFKDYLFKEPMGGPLSQKVMSELASYGTDFMPGGLVHTGNPLDIAIEGSGFIALEGDIYTRKGDLKIDEKGYLVSAGGRRVMGKSGPISVPKGSVEIAEDGQVSVEGTVVDTIKIVDVASRGTLVRTGDGSFTGGGTQVAAKGRVAQGYLERSNVEIVREMVKMIETMREFEAYQKAIHAFDEASAKVNNEMGRI
jgi:flagellar basal-body rod protein FlgG